MAVFANDIDIKAIGNGERVPSLAYSYYVASNASTERLAETGHLALSSSSQIMGRFQSLKMLRHPHLCAYVDIHRDKQDRVFVVAEHFETSLHKPDESAPAFSNTRLLRTLAGELLLALAYLHDQDIVHGCLAPHNVLLDHNSRAKLAGYGLYYMTGQGEDVDFPIGYPNYLAPEYTLNGEHTAKGDIWSLGVMLLELSIRHSFWTTSDLGLIFDSLSTLCTRSTALDSLGHENTASLDINEKALAFLEKRETENEDEDALRLFLLACLQIDPADRPNAHQLLSSPFFAKTALADQPWIHGPVLSSDALPEQPLTPPQPNHKPANMLQSLSLAQIYHLWRLAGGDVALDAAKRNVFMSTPVIEQLPRSCSENEEIGTNKRDLAQLYVDTVYPISFKELYQRLDAQPQDQPDRFAWDTNYFTVMDEDDVNFLLNDTPGPPALDLEHTKKLDRTGDDNDSSITTMSSSSSLVDDIIFTSAPSLLSTPISSSPASIPTSVDPANGLQPTPTNSSSKRRSRTFSLSRSDSHSSSISQHSTSPTHAATATNHTLPLFLREQNVHYQYQRQALFSALLQQYPASRQEIIHHAKVDIPPLLRGKIWAAILGVRGDCQKQFDQIDKYRDFGANRQIDVDVPRCHQYHDLLASSVGHGKLRRLLKAWVAANPGLVYWQGLDSLCAPFLTLNFNDEALAFACLQRFIPRFLKNFFLSDNAPVLQEYLAIFRHLISYHDPQLSSHLETIGFLPDLYAIPWFLTLFTHVFPLDKTYHLWDKFLVGPSSLPLFAGVAILRQIRDTLLSCEFNDCIVLISDSFPKVDIEKCVQNALAMCKVTPPSVCARMSEAPTTGHGEPDESLGHPSPSLPGWTMPMPIDLKKKDLAPRMHSQDFLSTLPHSLVLDIRHDHDFVRGHLPGSMNVQPQHLKNYASIFKRMHRKYHVVIAENEEQGAEYAGQLVHQEFPRVALLQGGMLAVERIPGFSELCYCKPQKQTTAEFRGKGTDPPFVIRRCKEPNPRS
ncbi:hypothetical protein DM01DRAFT_1072584 [Hesseltinella vesiculosa]|uniref:TBC-domain-containing protein n=1 Tax=Hesseltinella vesiculosa TaxID=101127 RepID=A0A1X2GVS5_9FUNG|nr:hypothetical protein DM01DRAFT_1072584 [Hesseltinella vesiculosa]